MFYIWCYIYLYKIGFDGLGHAISVEEENEKSGNKDKKKMSNN